jgi:hypothetical protein
MQVISLVQLNASRNHISDIHEEAFVGQSRLQAVDISGNNITYIEPKTFKYNPHLERLSISSNRLLELPEEGQFLHSASLRVLRLSACDLKRIPPKTFEKVPNLEELYISNNRIEILPPLKGTGSLTLVDLSSNYLTALDPAFFTASPKVHHLNVSYNRLSELDIIPHLPNTTSSEELDGNRWECNCSTFHIAYSWCHNNSVDLRVSCSSPPKLKGRLWTVWGEKCCGDDNDCVFELGDFEVIANLSPSNRRHEIRQALMHAPSQIQELLADKNLHHNYYMSFLYALSVVCFCSITIAGVMWCYLTYIRSTRILPSHSDVEDCDL